MQSMILIEELRRCCQQYGALLYLPAPNQLFVQVVDEQKLGALSQELQRQGYHLVTLIGTDERRLIDKCFKLTYLFGHPREDLFLFVESLIEEKSDHGAVEPVQARDVRYTSLYATFIGVDPFERELVDTMGLYPYQDGRTEPIGSGAWLHKECYPPELYPLRRDRTTTSIRDHIEQYRCMIEEERSDRPLDGEWLLPVGPVHAGVIEPGQFLFRLSGETVEELTIRLGYTHKGIEHLFQTTCALVDGCRLAEHVSGDSAFAHSLAYCQAAEALAGIPPPREAELLRGLFLELERIANHIGDCAALTHDVAYDVASSELMALREHLLRLNQHLAGCRLLRGRNQPGGILLHGPPAIAETREVVLEVAQQFAGLAEHLARLPAFRDRMQWTGILTERQAHALGATGLVARASGILRDFRLRHPTGIYTDPKIQQLVKDGLPKNDYDSIEAREATAGDALARFLIRVREVGSSSKIINYILDQPELNTKKIQFVSRIDFRSAPNFEFGLGYVEGWRGDVIYWLMKDKFERIFRCKVRDPSMLNWPALKAAVDPHELDDAYMRRYKPPAGLAETIVADFPIVNKSFNLSYSGNDL